MCARACVYTWVSCPSKSKVSGRTETLSPHFETAPCPHTLMESHPQSVRCDIGILKALSSEMSLCLHQALESQGVGKQRSSLRLPVFSEFKA